MQGAFRRIEDSKAFLNVDKLLSNANDKFSWLSAFKDGFDHGSKMFSSLDMKEFHPYISTWITDKIYQLTDPNLRHTLDDIVYKIKRFDSHLSSYIVQNTPTQGQYLSNRISQLFRGNESLPRRILAAKSSPRLKDNLLVQELYPLLQSFQDVKHPKYHIDNLKLFSKKLQTFDVDLLSDSFLELQEIAPELARDLIEFSVLQSGFHFSPNAFFQILPSSEVLKIISPYFDRYAKDFNINLDTVWEDFIQNSWKDSKVVPRLNYRVQGKRGELFKKGTIQHTSNQEYVTISAPTGETKTIGGISKLVYELKLFKNLGPTKQNPDVNNFQTIPKKGDGMSLIEAGAASSILKSNVSKYGLEEFSISKFTEKFLEEKGSAIIVAKDIVPGGLYLTPGGARINISIVGELNINDIYKGNDKAKSIGVFTKGREGLQVLAEEMGYKNWDQAKISKDLQPLIKGKNVLLYRATTLDSGNYSTTTPIYDYGYDPTRQQGSEQLFKSKEEISNEVEKVVKEKDNCKTKKK